MKHQMKTKEFYGKPKRIDFYFERVFNPFKSGTNAEYANGQCVKLGTNQQKKLPIREFLPSKSMNRHQRRVQMVY